ncbi:MAG: TetR family transcriptional regulator [Candidatus Edwardsbacteria bacterium]|nr:TetR family transcriptional regulator [Candidatus Edwardsbacteria bacterium]
MSKTPKGALARERIFKTGAVLFAQKGYHAVGVREIAEVAGVKLPMISYYFGGKQELLKEIITSGFASYYGHIKRETDAATDPEQKALAVARGIIGFFREFPEIALVTFSVFPVNMAEVHRLRTWLIKKHSHMNPHLYQILGLAPNDPAMVHVFSEFMYAIIRNHFQYRYSLNFYPTAEQAYTKQKGVKDVDRIFDDAFYQRYAEIVARAFILSAQGMKKK